jgi:hypothetical protein
MVNMGHGLGDAGDFLLAAGERERALKCGCLPRNAGDLTGHRAPDINVAVSDTCNIFVRFLTQTMKKRQYYRLVLFHSTTSTNRLFPHNYLIDQI